MATTCAPSPTSVALVDLQRVASTIRSRSPNSLPKLVKRGNAAAVAFDGDDARAGIEQRTGQAAGARADLIDALAVESPGIAAIRREQLPVEDEILPERLARAEAVAGNDLAQRLRVDRSSAVGAAASRSAAAIRIAAAIGRGSARSWPAMSNAVPWSGAVRTIGRPSVTLTASSK